MALVLPEVLVIPKYLENVQTTQYLSSGVVTRIDKCTLTNTSGSNVDVTLNVVPSGDVVAGYNTILSARTLAPGETYVCPELVGQVLGSGAVLSGAASVATAVVIAVAGRKFS